MAAPRSKQRQSRKKGIVILKAEGVAGKGMVPRGILIRFRELKMLGLLSYWRARKKRLEINRRSAASDPAGLTMADRKLKVLCPSLYILSGPVGCWRCLFRDGLGQRCYIRDMLVHGDSRAAVVVSEFPFLVACYCDDLDGVCLLGFCENITDKYCLRTGDRLLTVLNSMCLFRPAQPGEIARDLVQGNAANPHYVNFWPLIAEFLSDDHEAIAARKKEICPKEYERCRALGEEHLKRFGGAARDGRPDRSMRPVEDLRFVRWGKTCLET